MPCKSDLRGSAALTCRRPPIRSRHCTPSICWPGLRDTFPKMTPDQIIALAASIAACLSAVATFLTVRQMAMQRAMSYRPELVFSSVYFDATPSQIRGSSMPEQWVSKDLAAREGDFLGDLALPLRNVGLGTARAVSVKWSFELDQTVARANHAAQRTLTPAYFSIDEWGISIKSEALGNGTSMWRNQREVSIDYVLPASIQKEPVLVRLPHTYIQLCSALVFLESQDEATVNSIELPPLRAAFTFGDVGGVKHSTLCDIEVKVVMRTGDGKSMKGFIKSSTRA